jgi:hypothetical protein
MDASVAARIVAPRPNITAGRTEFVYTRPMVGLPQGDSPMHAQRLLHDHGRDRRARRRGRRHDPDLGRPVRRLRLLLLKDGKPVFLWNLVDLERIKWEGTEALAPGKHTVEFDFKYDGLGAGTLAFNDFSGVGGRGTGTLRRVDGCRTWRRRSDERATTRCR